MTKQIKKTSWESSASWYDKVVEKEGHYYHKQVILPKFLEIMQVKQGANILDLACGQEILARVLPKQVKPIPLGHR